MTCDMWMTRTNRWKVSHLVSASRQHAFNGTWSITACGKHVNVNHLDVEPTGIDTIDRCAKCAAKAGVSR